MAGWNHNSANWKSKVCKVCGAAFTPKSGSHTFCSPSCKGKWKYVSGSTTTDSQYMQISGDWSRYISRLLYCHGRKRDGLSRDMLLNKLSEQNYRCALTGVPLTCTLSRGVVCDTNASVDRIVAGGPYTIDNVQLVCRAVNMWRCNTPIPEFVEWCRLVVTYADNRTLPAAQGEQEQDHGQNA